MQKTSKFALCFILVIIILITTGCSLIPKSIQEIFTRLQPQQVPIRQLQLQLQHQHLRPPAHLQILFL